MRVAATSAQRAEAPPDEDLSGTRIDPSVAGREHTEKSRGNTLRHRLAKRPKHGTHHGAGWRQSAQPDSRRRSRVHQGAFRSNDLDRPKGSAVARYLTRERPKNRDASA